MTTLATYPHVDSSTESIMRVAPGAAGFQTVMVNVYFLGDPDNWVLVDAGVPMQAHRIIRAAEQRFGRGTRPNAVILTHGHFDHVGSLEAILEHWDVPVYAHRLEMPYLSGQSEYPPPDPTVGGGLWSRLSPLFPRGPYDFRPHLRELPSDMRVPGVNEWRWIHTPGHSPGHVSLFRESDRALIAGDAFTTQQQESFFAVMTNAQKVHGPPMYYTIDWDAARASVQHLAELEPASAGTGHGLPMFGDRLRIELTALALHFRELGMPRKGRYVDQPAVTDESGILALPPKPYDPVPALLAAGAVVGIGAFILAKTKKSSESIS